jgi:predicted branched-subunit amino acid permease
MTAHMQTTQPTTTSEILEGAALSVPIIVGVAPFGALFGMLAIDNGFSVADAVFMSAAVYGGASQMVGVELFGTKVAPWLIVLSIFAVNFRHVLYSATVGRHLARWPRSQQAIGYFLLVDPLFAESERRADRGIPLSFAWYMGMGIPVYVAWLIATYLGAIFGRLIPDPHAVGIDFLLPIYFFCLVLTFRGRAHWLPVAGVSAIASILAYHTIGSPWHVTVGAFAGILLGAFLPPAASKPDHTEEGTL